MPKVIEEFVGRVNTGDAAISIARMKSPAGWEEPAQTPEFDEYTRRAGRALASSNTKAAPSRSAPAKRCTHARASGCATAHPEPGGAEYIAVCLPAFSPDTVNRDE